MERLLFFRIHDTYYKTLPHILLKQYLRIGQNKNIKKKALLFALYVADTDKKKAYVLREDVLMIYICVCE